MARSSRAPRRSPTPAIIDLPAVRPALPERKPMARSTRVSLFERTITTALSPAAIEVLFDAARPLHEHQLEDDRFVGSTMLTIDLASCAGLVAEPPDAGTAKRVADSMPADERVRARARRLAIDEARRAGGDLDTPQVDLRTRAAGARLHLDLDVEARRKS